MNVVGTNARSFQRSRPDLEEPEDSYQVQQSDVSDAAAYSDRPVIPDDAIIDRAIKVRSRRQSSGYERIACNLPMRIGERAVGAAIVLDVTGNVTSGEGEECLRTRVNSLVKRGHKTIFLNVVNFRPANKRSRVSDHGSVSFTRNAIPWLAFRQQETA
jgi:hypothetical protein